MYLYVNILTRACECDACVSCVINFIISHDAKYKIYFCELYMGQSKIHLPLHKTFLFTVCVCARARLPVVYTSIIIRCQTSENVYKHRPIDDFLKAFVTIERINLCRRRSSITTAFLVKRSPRFCWKLFIPQTTVKRLTRLMILSVWVYTEKSFIRFCVFDWYFNILVVTPNWRLLLGNL